MGKGPINQPGGRRMLGRSHSRVCIYSRYPRVCHWWQNLNYDRAIGVTEKFVPNVKSKG